MKRSKPIWLAPEVEVIRNPILTGFHADPSILRVGDDYYIATSTFEWFPGVRIYHSRNLSDWRLAACPLSRVSQLDMKGVPDSCGVWAPCLSYDDGVFYLVYSNVKSFDGPWKDTPNYVVTATDIEGEWSEPSFLSSAGFDGSLFHDEDGCKWYLSMRTDHRDGDFFGGITLQAFDLASRTLVGPVRDITKGTRFGRTEGPHLYQKNGYYYLLLAEGGTEYGHCATMMRSRKIDGPYEEHPSNPLITTRDAPEHPLQKAGHGSLVCTPAGDWYMAFLVGRPLATRGRCILGRETALEALDWVNGWPKLQNGSRQPRLEIPGLTAGAPPRRVPERQAFSPPALPEEFQSLRVPVTNDWCSTSDRPGYLRLRGRESLTSLHEQSLIARRLDAFKATATTIIEFEPSNFQQMAGLVLYYNSGHYHYLHLTAAEQGSRKVLSIISSDDFRVTRESGVDVTGAVSVHLRAAIDGADLQFSYSLDGEHFHLVGPVLDASLLSDDHVREGSGRYRPAFTGCFVGLCCQDLATHSRHADFEWFEYRPLHS